MPSIPYAKSLNIIRNNVTHNAQASLLVSRFFYEGSIDVP